MQKYSQRRNTPLGAGSVIKMVTKEIHHLQYHLLLHQDALLHLYLYLFGGGPCIVIENIVWSKRTNQSTVFIGLCVWLRGPADHES
jgi:hypothetical protein